jgi:hypothetical protein
MREISPVNHARKFYPPRISTPAAGSGSARVDGVADDPVAGGATIVQHRGTQELPGFRARPSGVSNA